MRFPTKWTLVTILALAGLLLMQTVAAQQRGGEHPMERSGQRDAPAAQERDMERQRERVQDPTTHGVRDRAPLHAQDRDRLRDRDIYGAELMTREERREYRQRLAALDSDGEWARFRGEHQREMQRRAAERGVDLPRPFYGQQLMTDAERAALHERLRAAASEQERERIHGEHRQRMLERARALQIPEDELASE